MKSIINFRSCASKGVSQNICNAFGRSGVLVGHTNYHTCVLALSSSHIGPPLHDLSPGILLIVRALNSPWTILVSPSWAKNKTNKQEKNYYKNNGENRQEEVEWQFRSKGWREWLIFYMERSGKGSLYTVVKNSGSIITFAEFKSISQIHHWLVSWSLRNF